MYTNEQLEEAKSYILQRERNVRSIIVDIDRIFDRYVDILLTAVINQKSDAEIEELLAEITEQVYQDCLLLAVDEHDRKDTIIAFISRPYEDGVSLRERLQYRVNSWWKEIAVVWLACGLLRKGKAAALTSIKANYLHPYDNSIIQDARRQAHKGLFAGVNNDAFDIPTFGKGIPVSSKIALRNIGGHAIAEGWNEWAHLNAVDNGAIGYYVVRGSSYPCDICDSAASHFHPIEDLDYLPCLHLHCMCVPVYVYK